MSVCDSCSCNALLDYGINVWFYQMHSMDDGSLIVLFEICLMYTIIGTRFGIAKSWINCTIHRIYIYNIFEVIEPCNQSTMSNKQHLDIEHPEYEQPGNYLSRYMNNLEDDLL